MQIYIVRAGDSLYAIARRFGTTVEELTRLNQIADPSRLVIGQSLIVSPAPPRTCGSRSRSTPMSTPRSGNRC